MALETDNKVMLVLLNQKKERIFQRLNRLYNSTKSITSFDSRANEHFMAESETIDDLRDKFEVCLDEINRITVSLDPSAIPDYANFDSFEDLYTRVKRTRNKLSAVVTTERSHEASKPTKSVLKLQPLVIPSFDGRPENWNLFYQSFRVNIHLNDQLSDSQRVQYLISKLTGDALKFTAGIVPTGETYHILWDSLVKKYQDKRALGTYYLNNILDLTNCSHNANNLDMFISMFSASMSALQQLEIPDLTDFVFMQCALRKMDVQTIQAFELSVRSIEIPTSQMLICFVQDQAKILERSYTRTNNWNKTPASNSSRNRNARDQHTYKSFVASEPITDDAPALCKQTAIAPSTAQFTSMHSASSAVGKQCALCGTTDHTQLYHCPQFKKLDARGRYQLIKSKHGCVNCVSTLHNLSNCNSSSVCEFCKKRHHTLLHFEYSNKNKTHSHTASVNNNVHQLLPNPSSPPVCALSSAGAPTAPIYHEPSFITEAVTQSQPSLSQHKGYISMTAASENITSATSLIPPSTYDAASLHSAVVKPKAILLSTAQVYARPKGSSGSKRVVRCLIDNGSQNNLITTECCRILNLPITPLSNSFVKGVGSASRPIIGFVYLDIESRIYPERKYSIHALVVECITEKLPTQFVEWKGDVKFQNIQLADFNWNIPGNIDLLLGAQLFPYIYLGDRVDCGPEAPLALLTAFGYVLMGDFPRKDLIPISEPTFTALALNDLVQKFWELEEVPTKRFLSPEETECENIFTSTVTRDDVGCYTVALPFCRDPSELGNSHASAYRRLMTLERKLRQTPALRENYNKVIQDYIDNGYLSPVDKLKLSADGYYIAHSAVVRSDKPMPRIVLDASAKTHTGLSLNDVLHIGPNLQTDLFLLLLDFRLFPIAMNADIKQHYLRISVPTDQRKYLRILFRFNESEEVRTFAFNRQPFGLKSSPYIAMRTVRQLASDMSPYYPQAAKVAESCLYMDDLVHSVPNEVDAVQLAQDMIKMFKAGGFDLVKWLSNSPALLESLPDSHRKSLEFDAGNAASKVLGLLWEPCEDLFFFSSTAITEKCTKRNILSVVARLFDVLGLVAPVILYAKLLIKELWLSKSDWDEPAPEHIRNRFTALAQEFHLLDALRIPRHIGVQEGCELRLVAFCDASMDGLGCVIYTHCTYPTGIQTRLLCAKSKVSPTKITTLARLELCAALLMSKLVKTVRDTYAARIPIVGIYAFSDSTIALSWIHSSPHRWSIFVSNRVAQCQENLAAKHFYHVAGAINPSDGLSRGMLPSQLLSHDLWWNGPPWIRCAPEEWPVKPFSLSPANCNTLPEHKANVLNVTSHTDSPLLCALAQRVSSWDKLLRIIAYVLKFALPNANKEPRSVSAMAAAEKALLRALQAVHFADDIKLIKAGKLPAKRLQSLAVFLDKDNILRIGGRLSGSQLPYEAKHPVLLPKRDHVVDLIIQHSHVVNCHTGPGLLMSILRQRYWILDARTIIRAKLRKCNTCFKTHPTHPTPMMADLPSYRVSEAKAFTHTGVDYAGPIRITLSRRRGQHALKSYICLFVCMVTKAVHIELVSDLTSDIFLAAFKRFISRRGPVSCLYSDNATTYVGAKAQLDELYSFLLSANYKSSLSNELLSRRIEWKMIPPRAPNFGAMWESNIKSMKTHLYRVIGSQLLTYEELQTVLTQIESIMNSRPLSVLSSDPHPEVLTPAHFLMSTPLQYLPAADLSEQRVNLHQRKQLLDSMVQSFWKKWHLEYLNSLQVRQKWAIPYKPIEIGTVVLVELENTPPLNWQLGIITEVYKGSNDTVRVAMVKTQSGFYKRAITKLYPIPTQ